MKDEADQAKSAPEPLLTTDDLAKWLQIDPKTVRALIYEGHLPTIRIGKRVLRFDRRDVEKYLEGARKKFAPPPKLDPMPLPWTVRRGRETARQELDPQDLPWVKKKKVPAPLGPRPAGRKRRARSKSANDPQG